MTQLKFLESNDDNSYNFTNKFIQLYDSGNDICSYLIDDIKNISGLDNINMIYNGILCTLREGYLNKKIMVFPDSIDKFNTAVPLEKQRVDYCNMVYEIYGFKGRGKDPSKGDYTPNANYRFITTMRIWVL